jgi:uncharacterized membrane protein YfcA
LIPGVIGAVWAHCYYLISGKIFRNYQTYFSNLYIYSGPRILFNAFRKNRKRRKTRRVGWLAGAGGFLDSFGGGGWGPLVTSTLISKGKTPRYIIGTVSLTEFS